jgi:hypothetical protein
MDNVGAHDNPGMAGLLVTTSRITRSQFIHAEKSAGELKITDRSSGPIHPRS